MNTSARKKSGKSTSARSVKGPTLDATGKPVVKLPRSDIGTIVPHWITTTAMITSMVTGLRISADAEGAFLVASQFAKLMSEVGKVSAATTSEAAAL